MPISDCTILQTIDLCLSSLAILERNKELLDLKSKLKLEKSIKLIEQIKNTIKDRQCN